MSTLIAGEKFGVIHRGIEYEFEAAGKGGYVASVPLYPSAVSQGDTFEEALENIQDGLVEVLTTARELGIEIPEYLRFLAVK